MSDTGSMSLLVDLRAEIPSGSTIGGKAEGLAHLARVGLPVPDALVIMTRAYRKLGIDELADDALRVLRLNYPERPEIAWLEDPRGYEAAQKGSRSWKLW